MKFKAVIFDMDGVLVDTERYYLQRREEFFGSHDISIAHLTPSDFIGGNMREIWPRILGEKFNPREAVQLQKEYEYYKATHPMPYADLLYPDVTEILDYLKEQQTKIALASSSSMNDIQQVLSIHRLQPYFEVVLSGNDLKETKPNPEIYLSAIQKLQVKAIDSLVIEDSEKGISAGKAAGATVWAIKDYRFGMNQEKADQFVDSLTSAKNLLTTY